jgi:hypothetical protein
MSARTKPLSYRLRFIAKEYPVFLFHSSAGLAVKPPVDLQSPVTGKLDLLPPDKCEQ